MKVVFNLLNGRLPEKQTTGSAGYDLFSAENVVIYPGKILLVKLGFKMEIEEGYEAQIRSRSGLALKKNVAVFADPGTVDSDYRGEVGVLLKNYSENIFEIHVGDRIAQMIFSKVYYPEIIFSDSLTDSSRSCGGWGSTGVG